MDYWKILRLVIGILLFLSADKLSKNSVFYYVCGVSFGICASLLISIYFISKLFPRVSLFCLFSLGIQLTVLAFCDVRSCSMWMDSGRVYSANVMGKYKSNFATLSNVCSVVHFYNRFHQFFV